MLMRPDILGSFGTRTFSKETEYTNLFERIRRTLTLMPHDMLLLALINGLSSMALSGAAIFGILSVLSGSSFLHGLTGLAAYIGLMATATFVGYLGVCRFAAARGVRVRRILAAVFITHALGFLGAALVHPICVALSAGLGLGMFYAVFMLKSLNKVANSDRDSYATLNAVIQRAVALLAPVIGAATLYASRFLIGLENPLLPTFLTFALGVLIALPLISRLPDEPLPCSITFPMRRALTSSAPRTLGVFWAVIICECLMNPILMISSLALLGGIAETGGFASFVSAGAVLSVGLTHFIRVPEKRWIVLGGSLVVIGIGFLAFAEVSTLPFLLGAGVILALFRVNYSAAWYAFSSRLMEVEWGHLGKNQALAIGEILVLAARVSVALFVLVCGLLDLDLKTALHALLGLYLVAAVATIPLAKLCEKSHGSGKLVAPDV